MLIIAATNVRNSIVSKRWRCSVCVADPSRRDGKQERDPGFEIPGEGGHDHVGPVRIQGIDGRMQSAHAVLELVDQILLIAAMPCFVHHVLRGQSEVVRDVEEVPHRFEQGDLSFFDRKRLP